MTSTIERPEAVGPRAPTEAPKPRARLAHMPALDGMRGLFVILGPLAYHFAPYWVPGGIIGIDLFFVLSSFLIISIALNEWDNTGRIDMKGYGARRVRRLMPALVLTFVLTALWTATFLDPAQISKWTAGTVGAMSWMANWKEIFAHTNYFDASQYSNPQPFRHVWSFAIEEQFYLFAPFFVVFGLKYLNRAWIAGLAIAGTIVSAVWMSVVFDPNDASTVSRAYYGTDTRAFALLIGIAMAVVCAWWGQPRTRWGHHLTQFLGLAATVGFFVLMFTISEKTAWMFEYGGFLLVAVLAVLMTRAVSAPTGWLHWMYNNRFLRWAGRLGFGLYLYHWFVFIVVDSNKDADQPGLNTWQDLLLGFGLTFVIAWASYKYIERPFVKGLWRGWRFAFTMAVGFALAISLLLFANTVRAPSLATASGPLQTGAEATSIPLLEDAQCVNPAGSDPVKVLVVGDSVMRQIGQALKDWCSRNPGQLEVYSDAHLGCGTTRGGEKRYEEGPGDMGAVCATWADPVDPETVSQTEVVSWITSVQTYEPDVVLSYASSWDSIDRKVPQLGDEWVKPGDAPYDAYVQSEYTEALDVLSSTGADVAWMISPHLNRSSDYNDPARIDRLNALVLPLVEALPDHTLIDYPAYLGPTGGDTDRSIRDDGVHIRKDKLATVADWLAPQVVAAGTPNRDARVVTTSSS